MDGWDIESVFKRLKGYYGEEKFDLFFSKAYYADSIEKLDEIAHEFDMYLARTDAKTLLDYIKDSRIHIVVPDIPEK